MSLKFLKKNTDDSKNIHVITVYTNNKIITHKYSVVCIYVGFR